MNSPKKQFNPARWLIVCLAILAVLSFPGCTKDNPETKWIGTYEQQTKDKMTLVLKADHKGTLAGSLGGDKPGELTWEIAADDKIVVHIVLAMSLFRTADGNLRDDEGNTWKKK
jgi:hypothetical protein